MISAAASFEIGVTTIDGFFNGIARMMGKTFDYLADFVAPRRRRPRSRPSACSSCSTRASATTRNAITAEGASERDETPRIEAIRRRQIAEPHQRVCVA